MTCLRCQTEHEDSPVACPQVKAVEFDVEGRVTRVEYLTPVDFPRQAFTDQSPIDNYPKLARKDG